VRVLLTGAAGLIGGRIARKLSDAGMEIIAADDIVQKSQIAKLSIPGITDLISRSDLIIHSRDLLFFDGFDAIVHQGAITSTTHENFESLYLNNFILSKQLALGAAKKNLKFIYASSASVYGKPGCKKKDDEQNLPLNSYAFSKYLFDKWIVNHRNQINFLGLRYFNVYGPGEEHKNKMASMVFHGIKQAENEGCIKLFGKSGNIPDGEHKRDFVSVDDIANLVSWSLKNDWESSIVDTGTSVPETFNTLANLVFKHLNLPPRIEYIEMPSELSNQYQSFTKADERDLQKLGYDRAFTSLDAGIANYVHEMANNE